MHTRAQLQVLVKLWTFSILYYIQVRLKIVNFLCLLRLCIFRVLWCSVCFCTGHFVMVSIILTCPHCLQHFFFEHLFHLYWQYPLFYTTAISRDWCKTCVTISFYIRSYNCFALSHRYIVFNCGTCGFSKPHNFFNGPCLAMKQLNNFFPAITFWICICSI